MHQESSAVQKERTQSVANDASGEFSFLDLYDLPEAAQRERILKAYSRLMPGQRLEIFANQRPRDLFTELQGRYGPSVYWWPLENGMDRWRVMLAKPAPEADITVCGVLGADHHRLHDLWQDLRCGIELCQLGRIHRRLAEFSLGLRRNIAIEETVLFPVFEQQTEMNESGPTTAMRSEHRQIEKLLNQLDMLHAAKDCAAILDTFEQVLDCQPTEPSALFRSHDSKEEAVLYPLMDRVFEDEEKKGLLSLVQAFET
ncbi:MAG: hemerythrin domain-containing protein [Candidatus Binataceae bacterium]